MLINSLLKTNDPRENKNFRFGFFRFSNSEDVPQYKKNSHYEKLVNALLRRNMKVSCFCTDYILGDNEYAGYNLSRMWATYGQMHRGVCLEIDFEKFSKLNSHLINNNNFKKIHYVEPGNNSNFPEFDVTYAEQIGVESYIEIFIEKYFDYFYFTKLKDWESEHEMRLLHKGNRKLKEFCNIENCIKSVILGVKATPTTIRKVRHVLPETSKFQKVEFERDSLILKDI